MSRRPEPWRSAYVLVRRFERVRIGPQGIRTSVMLALRTSGEIEIPIAPQGSDEGRARALAARIQDAMRVHQLGTATPEALLRRGDRTHATWVRALRTAPLLATHRRAAPTTEQLWRILEDPAGEALTRAAAAVALGELQESERARLARIACCTAAPRLRVALDALIEGENDEALAEALAALEEERRIAKGPRLPPAPK